MKIRTRLIISFFAVSLLVVLVGYINARMTAEREKLFDKDEAIAQIEIKLNQAIAAHSIWVKNVYEFYALRQNQLSVEVDPTRCSFGKFLFDGDLGEIEKQFPSIAKILEEVKTPHARLHRAAHQINEVWNINDLQTASREVLKILELEINPSLISIEKILHRAQLEGKNIEEQLHHKLVANEKLTKNVTIGVIIVAFLATIIMGNFIAGKISNPINRALELAQKIQKGDISDRLQLNMSDETGQMADAMDKMADALEEKSRLAEFVANGDLTVSVPIASNEDRLGLALQKMTGSLNIFLNKVKDSANALEASASQISDASQSLSQGATESSASLEEISSSMSEIDSQTKTNAENSSLASTIATQTREQAEAGNHKMADMMAAMEEIKESSKGIAKVIKIIDDIAFQTNLLSLNAAVEAARAGRHGKGFAVVADEVRSLAGRSAKAARESSDMIADSLNKIESGYEIAQKTEEALQSIVQSSIKVSDLVAEISSASDEQAIRVSQINVGLRQIDDVTQHNSANSEETAAASVDLTSQARELSQILQQFQLVDRNQG